MSTIHSFASDNFVGAHPEIRHHVMTHDEGYELPYGEDRYSQYGAKLLKAAFAVPEADVYFVPNGTIANTLGCVAMLKSADASIISSSVGHIKTMEEGAVEQALGRPIITIEADNGKLNPDLIDEALESEAAGDSPPRAVYLTQSTDRGLVYTKEELSTLVDHNRARGLYSFVDGARLATALAKEGAAFTLQGFGSLGLDMFWVGGTKNGGMFGEALVVLSDELKEGLPTIMKQRGATLSKGRYIGLQFERFFKHDNDLDSEDNLWLRLARNANAQANTIYEGLLALGIEFHYESGTNMLFPVFPDGTLEKLRANYFFYPSRKIDEARSRVRLVCSWNTTSEIAEGFVSAAEGHLVS